MDYSLEPDLADLDPEVINKRTKEDFSEAADKHIKSAEELAKNGYLEKALQLLHSLEKQTRTAADVASAERVLISIVSLCFEANKLPLLQENIVLLCKRRGQLNSAITKMISKCCEFVDSITNLEDKLNYIKTLREVTDGKIYVELFRARLTMSLAIIREEMGEVTEAADILQELQVETFGSMQRKEKVEFMLQQVRLCLAKEDFIRAQIISNKIPYKTLESDDFQNEKLRFHKLMIQLDEHEKNYLSICRHYLAMYNTKIVKEDDDLLKENLKHILAYLILAPYDNEQWDLLNRIYNDVNCDKIPTYKELLKCFITKEILDWSAFGKAFISEFEKSGCYSSDFDGKMKALSQRVSEHNTRVIAGYYNRISVNRMSELLGLSNQETETIVSDLVVQKKIFAKIDRPAGIITFSRVKDPNEILNDWTNNINQLMSLVENNTHKISTKNAWELDLISHMQRLNIEEGVVNYAKASRALEASAKIYSARVDSVYEDMHKYKINLTGSTKESNKTTLTDASNAPMRKRRPAKTIETEVEKIRLDESAIIKYCADPLFFRVSKKFDPSKSSGLILNNIGVFHGAKVTFNSFVPEYVVKRPPLRPIPFETLVPTSLLNNLKICQSFSHVTRLDLEGAPSQNEANPTNQEADDFSDFGEPMDLWNEPPETAFANDPLENFGKENEGQEACALHANTFEGSIVGNSKFSLALSTDPYSYFDPKIFRAWSGPEHWKYHPIINKNTNETKRNPKESKLIDFSDLSKYTLDFKGSASTILSQLTLNKLCEEKNTLPKDEHYGIADLYRFFLKPRWTISKNLRGIPNLKEASFLSNEATSILNNYEEDMLDNDDGLQNETETVRRHIEKVEINYAKQPTRMDVTLLKTNILNALESKISKHEKPKFSEIFKKIPKQMPEELARNVSVPMCFVCLLHLANEKGLCIEQNDSMSDLVVSFNGA